MIIEEEFGNDYYGNLVIENYPNLEKIVVKKYSLKNLNSLKICNNENLKTIEIENDALEDVKSVIIESISIVLFHIFKSSQSTIIYNRRKIICIFTKIFFIK